MIVFVGMALFGFSWMNHDMSGMETGQMTTCPLATLLSFGCTLDAISMTFLHLSAFTSFSNAVPVLSILLALALAIIASVYIAVFRYKLIFSSGPGYARNSFSLNSKPASILKFYAWLSLFENSPSFAMR